MDIRPLLKQDWPSVAEIYKEGIETGNATFENAVPTWDQWDSGHLNTCRIVATVNGEVSGWAALSKVSGRCVYAGVAEVSIYVAARYAGHKIGTRLLEELIAESESHGFWTLQAGIFPENTASLRLHEKLGFRVVGYREKIGKMNTLWRDTVLLERRSKKIGIG